MPIKITWHCRLLTGLLALSLAACEPAAPRFHAEGKPPLLSDWNIVQIEGNELVANAESLVFAPANTLFSDHAQKYRSLWLPEGSMLTDGDGEGAWDYPVGTILSKTFYYPRDGDALAALPPVSLQRLDLTRHRLLETRLLVRRETGWQALPYVWNEAQDEATLRVAGASFDLSLREDDALRDFSYFVPNENQCAGCHVKKHPDGGMEPLGAIASQLQDAIPALLARGWLQASQEPAPVVSWHDEAADPAERALAYLNMNCGHCHNPDGPADTSALILDGNHRSAAQLGVCKPPVAAGGGAGDLLYGIVPGVPERSILVYRMRSTEPDEMMPELGRSLVHDEGVALVADWIDSLSGNCE